MQVSVKLLQVGIELKILSGNKIKNTHCMAGNAYPKTQNLPWSNYFTQAVP